MHKKKEDGKMPLVKIKDHYQITLPNNLRKNFNIAIGDYMEIEKRRGNYFKAGEAYTSGTGVFLYQSMAKRRGRGGQRYCRRKSGRALFQV